MDALCTSSGIQTTGDGPLFFALASEGFVRASRPIVGIIEEQHYLCGQGLQMSSEQIQGSLCISFISKLSGGIRMPAREPRFIENAFDFVK